VLHGFLDFTDHDAGEGGATGSSSSTSRPAMVRVSASCWVVRLGLQYSRNQDSGNCIVRLFGVHAVNQAVCHWLGMRISKDELSARGSYGFQHQNYLKSFQHARQLTFYY
jgi:hypothetical protein